MKKKRIALAIVFATLLFSFSAVACALNYNAVLFYNEGERLCVDFQRENLTRWSMGFNYRDGWYDVNPEESETLPTTRTIIVKDYERFNEIFVSFPTEIDFDNQMIILYTFTAITGIRPYEIRNINSSGQILNIEYRLVRIRPLVANAASMPRTRWLIVKMDRLDITEVVFNRV